MKLLLVPLFLFAAIFAVPAAAADSETYGNGAVWLVTMIKTKPGHFDDYMRFLATQWKAAQEVSKKRGLVIDYKVLTAIDPRDIEPDLYVMVEYKNMAVLDASREEEDSQIKAVFGSKTASLQADVDRDNIRTLRGMMLTRELILK